MGHDEGLRGRSVGDDGNSGDMRLFFSIPAFLWPIKRFSPHKLSYRRMTSYFAKSFKGLKGDD